MGFIMPSAGRTLLPQSSYGTKEIGQSGWKKPSGSLLSFEAVLFFSLLEQVNVSVESLSMR